MANIQVVSVSAECMQTVLLPTFLLHRKVHLFIHLNSDELVADLSKRC